MTAFQPFLPLAEWQLPTQKGHNPIGRANRLGMAEKRIAAFMAGNNPLRTIEPASNRSARGETACPGRSIRMEKLDGIVLDALKQRVLSPDRLPKLL